MPTARTYTVHMETTVADLKSARTMISTILEEGLAAIAWLSQITSFDHADDEGSPRRFVAFKTSPEGRRRLQTRVLQLHPEENPYLGWIRLHESPPEYLHFVRRRTSTATPRGAAKAARRQTR